MKKQTGVMRYFLLLLCLVACLLSVGCSKEVTKVVVLDESGDTSDENEYSVKNIKEYFYEGVSDDENWIAWENDSEYIYIIKKTDESYELRKIDIGRRKIISKTILPIEKTDIIKNVKISPGGKCIAYEKEYTEGAELYLYYTETYELYFVYSAREIQFEWSGDGKKLFYSAFENTYVDNNDSSLEKEITHVSDSWSLNCWDVGIKLSQEKLINKAGDTGSKKTILPGKDGLQVYIFNEERTGKNAFDSFITLEDNLYYYKNNDGLLDDTTSSETFALPKEIMSIKQKKIIELPKEIIRPLKYTKAGLYAQGNDGKIYLVTNLLKKPIIKMVAKVDGEQIFICENGDHIFVVKHEDGTEQFEVHSMYLKNGEVVTNNLLYKDNYRSWTDAIVSMDDNAIMIKSCEYFGEKKYSMKIIVLEY